MRFFLLALPLLVPGTLASAQPRVPCAHEDALDRVAAHLVDATTVDGLTLAAMARAEGEDLPSLHAVSGADDARIAAGMAAYASRADAPLVCGEALSHGRRLVILGARGGTLTAAGTLVRATLAPGFRDARFVLLDARGATRDVPFASDGAGSGALELALDDLALPVTVQLVATGRFGPRPVAALTVGGVAGPQPVLADDPLTLVDVLRIGAGARAVRENDLLEQVARTHARDVCDAGRVAHELHAGGDPVSRLAAASVRARVVGETVARGETLPRALATLAASPSHHETLVDPRFTDVGIGTALDDAGRTCVVVLLAAWPRFVPP